MSVDTSLLVQGIVGPEGDVYAAGCILWEMLHAQRVWAGFRLTELLHAKLKGQQGLSFATDLPEHLTVSSCALQSVSTTPLQISTCGLGFA